MNARNAIFHPAILPVAGSIHGAEGATYQFGDLSIRMIWRPPVARFCVLAMDDKGGIPVHAFLEETAELASFNAIQALPRRIVTELLWARVAAACFRPMSLLEHVAAATRLHCSWRGACLVMQGLQSGEQELCRNDGHPGSFVFLHSISSVPATIMPPHIVGIESEIFDILTPERKTFVTLLRILTDAAEEAQMPMTYAHARSLARFLA